MMKTNPLVSTHFAAYKNHRQHNFKIPHRSAYSYHILHDNPSSIWDSRNSRNPRWISHRDLSLQSTRRRYTFLPNSFIRCRRTNPGLSTMAERSTSSKYVLKIIRLFRYY